MNTLNHKGNLQLGLMDFGFVLGDRTPRQALSDSFNLARLADAFGFSRYWLPEHHEPHYAWAGPEIMLPLLAERTKRIRVGAAAILLNLYRPLKVAENFSLISRLHPGRVDLGVCSGLPLTGEAGRALMPKSGVADSGELYNANVRELIGFLHADEEAGHAGAALWLMGTGARNSTLAAANGTAMSYSLFHRGSRQAPELLHLYRDQFIPSPALKAPCANIAVSIICHEDEQAALRQKARVEEFVKGDIQVNITGTPAQCMEQLMETSLRFGVGELVLHSLWEHYEDRARSCRILAELSGLEIRHEPPMTANATMFEPLLAQK